MWATHSKKTSTLDVLWGQPIKLIQVFSTSEFHEYWWNGVVFIFFRPIHFVQGLRSLEYWLLQKLSMKTFDKYTDLFLIVIFLNCICFIWIIVYWMERPGGFLARAWWSLGWGSALKAGAKAYFLDAVLTDGSKIWWAQRIKGIVLLFVSS